MRQIPAERIRPGVAAFEGRRAHVITLEYAALIHRAGGSPVLLPEGLEPGDAVEIVDGLLMPGGEDVDPRWYGHAPDEHADIDMSRDVREMRLVYGAIEQGIPLLGICRGAQVINVALGGSLSDTPPSDIVHASWGQALTRPVHDVVIGSGTPFSKGAYEVNSAHHQMIAAVGGDAVAVAHATDGVVEAIMCADRGILGVQWHPECLSDPASGEWLVAQAERRRKSRRM